MQSVYNILLVLHIASAAVLFGGAMGLTRNLRLHLESPRPVFLAVTEEASRRDRLIGIFAIATLLTGVLLIFTVGGFGAVRVGIHIALTLMLVMVAVSATVMRPHTARLVKLAQLETLDREAARRSIRAMTIGQGVIHLLWLVILVLMIVR